MARPRFAAFLSRISSRRSAFDICCVTHSALMTLKRSSLNVSAPCRMARSAAPGLPSRHPLGCRIEPRHSLSGVRILHVAKAVPDQPADVQLVVQDAGSALGVAVDRARTPGAAERARNPFTIQALRDLLRRNAGDEVPEDPLDDRASSGTISRSPVVTVPPFSALTTR